MTDTIYDALRESHVIQRSLCRKLLRSEARTQHRVELFTQLRIELAAHEAAEERFLYIPIMLDDRGLDASRHALHEHHELDELIEDLQTTSHSGRSWLATAKKLSEKVHHHLREEERKFFQVSGKILSETKKISLARQYRKDYLRMHRVLKQA